MEKRIYSVVGALLAVALVIGGGWAVIRGVEAEPSVVGSFATALAAIAGVLIARNREQREKAAQTHRNAMSPIYEQLFIEFARTVEADEDRSEFFQEVHRKLLFYGPTPVVKAWLEWARDAENVPDDDSSALRLLLWERVLFAIRQDLGHNNDGLQAGDLLRLYINDADPAVRATLDDDKALAAAFKR